MMMSDVLTILNLHLSLGGISNMDLISCDKCGKEFPKSKLKKCQICGQILCFKCRLFHKCSPKDKEVVHSEYQMTTHNTESSQSTTSQSVTPITLNLKQGLYAQKHDFENLHGLFERGFKIPSGLKVFFIQNGITKITIRPGNYKSLSSVNNSLGKNKLILDDYTSIIITDTTFISLPFVISETNVKTKDGVGADITGNLSISINDAVRFGSHYLGNVSEANVNIISTNVLSILEKCAADIFTRYDRQEFENYSYLNSIVKDNLKDYLNDCLNVHGLNVITFSVDFKLGLPNIGIHDFESELVDFNHESNLESSVAEKPNVTPNAERGKEEFESEEYKRALASEYARKSYLSKERFYFEQSYPSGNFKSEMERMALHNPMDLPIQPALMSLMSSENSSVREVVSKELIRRAILVTPEDIISINRNNSLVAGNILASKCNFKSLTQLKNFMDEDCTSFESMMSELYGEFADEMICVLNGAFSEMCEMN